MKDEYFKKDIDKKEEQITNLELKFTKSLKYSFDKIKNK